jgi:hypothetical protein
MADDFIDKCHAAELPQVGRKHIPTALGHKQPRQFQYWQKGQRKVGVKPGYTPTDDKNFRRILQETTPEDFWKRVTTNHKKPQTSRGSR